MVGEGTTMMEETGGGELGARVRRFERRRHGCGGGERKGGAGARRLEERERRRWGAGRGARAESGGWAGRRGAAAVAVGKDERDVEKRELEVRETRREGRRSRRRRVEERRGRRWRQGRGDRQGCGWWCAAGGDGEEEGKHGCGWIGDEEEIGEGIKE